MFDLQPSGDRFARTMFALVLSLLPGLFGQASFAHPEVAADDGPTIVIQPDAVFTYRGDTWIHSIHLAPDGEHIYAHFQVGSVNLWAVLVFYWPEIVGVLIGLMLLVMLWRLIRRKRIVGQPHCRRCNYLLINAPSDRCPECGLLLTLGNRVIGRPQSRRIALAASLMLAITGGNLAGRARLPREGAVSDWFHWLSPRLYDWAWHHQHEWLHRHKVWITRIVEIDPKTGAILHTIYHVHVTVTDMPWWLELAPDGQSIFLWNYFQIEQRDARTGELLARLFLQGNPWAHPEYDQIQSITPSADGRMVYVATWYSGSIQVWDLETGEANELFTIQRGHFSTYVWLYDLQEEGRIGVYDWSLDDAWRFQIWDEQTQSFVKSFVEPMPGGSNGLVLSPDESTIYVACNDLPVVQVGDVKTGQLAESINAPRIRLHAPAISPDGRRLFLLSNGPIEVLVCDLESKRWTAALRGPVRQILSVVPMSDGHTVVVRGWNKGIWKIMVYDLDQPAEVGATPPNSEQ